MIHHAVSHARSTDTDLHAAGADLNDIAALDAAGARSRRYLEDLCSGMAAVRKPLLAAVNGPAVRHFLFRLLHMPRSRLTCTGMD